MRPVLEQFDGGAGSFARRVNRNIANMAKRVCVLVVAVIIDEPGLIRRLVIWAHARFVMALQSVHDFGAAKRDALHVFAFAQVLAGAPQRLAA